MTSPHVRVIKLGGSLLDWAPWPHQFRRWLAEQTPAVNVLVVGGGAIVEALRTLDRANELASETAHWLAIRAMGLTAAVAAERLSEARLLHTLDELSTSTAAEPQILDVEHFLRGDVGLAGAVPCSWGATSDSIAARLAKVLEARELVLLKSTLPTTATGHKAWAAGGYVDRHFVHAAEGLAVRYVDLRDEGFRQVEAR